MDRPTSARPTPGQGIATDAGGRLPVSVAAQSVVVVTADPLHPLVGQMWYRQVTNKLCIRVGASITLSTTFS